MEIASEESFAVESYYIATDKYLNISNWIWKRLDGAERFSFDSDAERDWAEILKDISVKSVQSVMAGKASAGTYTGLTNLLGERIEAEEVEEKEIFLWGKNYLPESRIKYEYYLDSKRSSYPDFVMKDRFGRIHIFEVKSVNRASGINIDDDEYFIKIEALKKCYKQASILTGYLFYLPVLENDVWKIYQYNNGIEDILTLDQFRTFVNTESK
jgi:type III restriction enzyme